MLLCQFLLNVLLVVRSMLVFSTQLWLFSGWLRWFLWCFSEMFHGNISLICMFLLLLSTASGFTLDLLYISLNESVKSSLFGLKSSHLLVLLPLIVKTILFVFTAKANLVNLMPRLGKPGSCGEVFLNLLSCVDKRWVSSYFRTVTLFDIFLK